MRQYRDIYRLIKLQLRGSFWRNGGTGRQDTALRTSTSMPKVTKKRASLFLFLMLSILPHETGLNFIAFLCVSLSLCNRYPIQFQVMTHLSFFREL